MPRKPRRSNAGKRQALTAAPLRSVHRLDRGIARLFGQYDRASRRSTLVWISGAWRRRVISGEVGPQGSVGLHGPIGPLGPQDITGTQGISLGFRTFSRATSARSSWTSFTGIKTSAISSSRDN